MPRWADRVLRSLSNRSFRLFLTGHAVSVVGTWMQRVAQDWLVLEMTGDAFAVGVATAMQFLPMLLFGLYGGVWVDRLDRRRLLLATQALSGLLAALLAVLVLAGAVSLAAIYAVAFMLGMVTVVDNPGRQAYVAELVGPRHYVNAQALTSTVHNAGRLVGPAVAGGVIALAGAGTAFAVNALSFLPVLWGLWLIDTTAAPAHRSIGRSRGQVREGLRYVWRHPELRACMLLVTVVALFGQNFRVVLPLLAREVYHGDAATYGWLTSALGAGAVAGAVMTAAAERVTSWALAIWALVFAAANCAGAVAPWLAMALVVMVAVGVSNIVFNTLARTLLQVGTEPGMHGRVMALHGFVFLGTTPIGGPLLGWLCDLLGARAGLWVAGLTAGGAALWVLPLLRRIRRGSVEVGEAALATDPDG